MPGYIIILHKCTINNIHDVWFLKYEAHQTEFFCHLEPLFSFLPLLTQKIKIQSRN